MSRSEMTVGEVAALERVKAEVVLSWIHHRQLHAHNAARAGAKRPRWRISPGAYEGFKQQRSNAELPQAPAPRFRYLGARPQVPQRV